MNPLIAFGVSELLKVLKDGAGANEVFSDGKLGRVIQKLLQNDVLGPLNRVVKGDINGDVIVTLLQGVFGSASDPFPLITNELLDKFLGKFCPGATTKENSMNPAVRTRETIRRSGNDEVDFIFAVDLQSVPQVLVDALGGDKNEIVKVVESAWRRWDLKCDGLKVTSASAAADPPNLTVKFGALDGVGTKLGEWTGTTFGTKSTHSILIDVAEQWTAGKLLTTLTHEIGHALGIDHVNDPDSIMSAILPQRFVDPKPGDVQLTAIDIAAIPRKWTVI